MKTTTRFFNLFVAVSLVLAAIGVPVTAQATSAVQPDSHLELRLQRATFDPIIRNPALPSNLTVSDYPGDGTGYYLVQFKGPILSEWKVAVQKQGAVVLDYVPQFAYIVRMNKALSAQIQSFDFVRWVGFYQPAFRLSTDLDGALTNAKAGDNVRIIARSFTGESRDKWIKELEGLGGKISSIGEDSGGGTIAKVVLPTIALPQVAQLNGTAWVEPWAEPILHNAIARSDLAMNKNAVEARLGLYGAGQIVVGADTGVSTGNEATMHDDFKGHFYKGTWGNGTCTSWADSNSHGTHTAGSVLGSGVRSGAITATHSYSGSNAGIAPEALLWAWAFCSDWSGLPETDPYNDYFGVMYNDDPRVRTNTNSWGYTSVAAGSYNAFSREMDRFIWEHKDMSVFFSAGNDGTDANDDGIVDSGSMGVPGGAKNVVTVGASENYRLSGGYNPGGECNSWGDCWPSDYGTNPVRDDLLSNDTLGMVAFSSRGPTLDGRLKPDVVAPGSNIVSTRYQGSGTGWGAYDAYYLYMGGTSMATPLTAGGGAVVREFYSVTHGITNPTAALVKATLINGARDMTPGQYRDEVPDGSKDDVVRRPDINQGWGRVDLYRSLVHDQPDQLWFYEDTPGLTTTQEYETHFTLSGSQHPLRITLAWSDYPGTEAANGGLVNDLDLTVVAPNGTTYYGNDIIGDGTMDGDVDHVNNVEGLDFTQLGGYTVRVRAYNTPQGPQPFALVVSGDIGDDNLGTLTGTVTDASSSDPISGAVLQARATITKTGSTTSGLDGSYSMVLLEGTYVLTTTKYGYLPATISGISIVSGTTTTQNVALALAPTYVISGFVRDSATNDPLWATINVVGTPFNPPFSSVQTNPATGFYSMTVAGGQSYALTASALLHTAASQDVTPVADMSVDFNLVATTQNGGIIGWVRNYYTNDPIPNATVTVETTGTPSDQTDANGYFEIFNLAPGTYTATATADLYSPVSLSSIQVLSSNVAIRTFQLPTSQLNYIPAQLNKTLTFGQIATDTAGLAISNTGMGALTYDLKEQAGGYAPLRMLAANYLVVNVDSSSTRSITQALTALGYTYDVTTTTGFNAITTTELLAYNAVIYPTNSSSGLAKLTTYLDNGGRLIVADNDFGYSNGSTVFYRQYLEADYEGDDATNDGAGTVVGEDIMSGLSAAITADFYPDYYTITGTNTTRVFVYSTAGPGNNYPAGSRTMRNGYRAVYLPFDFYFLGTSAIGEQIETDVLQRVLTWFGGSTYDAIPWFVESPISGTLAQNNAQDIQLVWNANIAQVAQPGLYTGTLKIENNDPVAQNASVPLVMQVNPAANQGLLTGVVSTTGVCDINPAPLNGATVFVEGNAGFTLTLSTNATGQYGYWLDEAESPYTVTVSYVDHPTTPVNGVNVTGGMTTTQNFTLRLQKPCLQVEPTSLSASVEFGLSTTLPLTLSNAGATSLDFVLAEGPAGGKDVLVVRYDTTAAAAMEAALTALGYTFDGVTDAQFQALSVPQLLAYRAIFYAGATSSASQTLLMAYLDAGGSVYISDNDLGYGAGTSTFYTAYLQSTYVADDALSDGTGNVVGEELMSGVTINISADPYPDYFNAGAQATPIFRYSTAGAGNGYPAGVRVARNGYKAVYTAVDFQNFAGTASQQEVVHRVMTFLGPDIPWFSESPITGTIASTANQPIAVTFDAAGLALPGNYTAILKVISNDPGTPVYNVPVTLTVNTPSTYGQINGVVSGLARCDAPGAPLNGATVAISGGTVATITTNANGEYSYYLPGGSTYTLTVSQPGYLGQQTLVNVTQQQTTTTNFNLRLDAPCQSLSASSASSNQPSDQVTTSTLTISNTGAASLNWNMEERAQARTTQSELLAPIQVIGSAKSERRPSLNPNYSLSVYNTQPILNVSLALINDGSFENSPSAWTEVDNTGCTPWIGDWFSIVGITAYHGSQYFWAGGGCNSTANSNSATQSIAVPVDSPVLSFYYWAARSDPDDPTNGVAYIRVNGVDVWSLSMVQANNTTDWTKVTVDLSAYAGQTVSLAFGANNVGSGYGNVFFDYVEWNAPDCTANALPWVTAIPVSGTVAPDSDSDVGIVFDSTGLSSGIYTGTLCLNTNDTFNPQVLLPVTMTVTLSPAYLTVTHVGNGTVSRIPAPPYAVGEVVTLTAIPDPGWVFSGWSGDLTGTTNPVTLTLTGNQVVTATFVLACVPVAGVDFTYAPPAPKVGQPVTFNGTALTGTAPITYTWNFGDGSSAGNGSPVTHLFPLSASAQSYTVTLTAENACGSAPVAKVLQIQPLTVFLPLITR